MGHKKLESYKKLQKRLDRFAQGAPDSDNLHKILEILFSKEEADLVSLLPIRPFTVKKAAKRLKKTEKETEELLNNLADKGVILDIEEDEKRTFVLMPTMAGFFEFSIMMSDGKFDRKLLSELFYQYLNVEEEFVARLFGLNIPIARTLVHEDMVPDKTEILDYEKASKVIEDATCITVGTCYCRHKMEHKGKACDNPQEVCLTFNNPAKSLAKHGVAREISKEEGLEILKKCIHLGLVQVGDNIQNNVGWICNCCSCCCEALVGYKKTGCRTEFGTNFFAINDFANCSGCTVCEKKCPVDAIKMESKDGKNVAVVDLEICIGCGVCTRFCPTKSFVLERKEKLGYTPIDSWERCALNAIETGNLQDYLFDNYESWTSEQARRFSGILLKSKAMKKMVTSKKIRSKFLFALRAGRGMNVFKDLYKEGEKEFNKK